MNSELENFIAKFQNEQNGCKKSADLHEFVQSFFQTPEENADFKNVMFLNLISKIPELFAVLTNFENSASNLNTVTDSDAKELKNSNLEGASLCLEILLLCYKHSEPMKQLSLFSTTTIVLHQSYTHCKDSEVFYGDLLEDFTNQLAIFLNKVQMVQMTMLSGINTLITSELSDSEANTVIAVCGRIGNLCNLVSSLDKMLAVQLWRAFMRIVLKYPDLSRERITIDPILSSLVSQVIEIVEDYETKMENEELVEESDIKILLYFTNLFMKLFHTFHSCLNKSFQPIQMLALHLTRFFIASYSPMIHNENNQQLKSALRNTTKAIILLLFSNSTFLNNFLQFENAEISPDLHIAQIIMTSSALDYKLSAKREINEDRKTIFLKAMSILETKKLHEDIQLTSIRIPNSTFKSSENSEQYSYELVPLYKYASIRFSKYSKNVSDHDFEKIENLFFKLLLSSSDIVSLLVSDIWIYRLRCSPVDYLQTRISSLLYAFGKCEFDNRFKFLLRRMVKFLPITILMELCEKHKKLKDMIKNSNKVVHRYGVPDLTEQKISKDNFKPLQMITILMNDLKDPILENSQLIAKACCLLELFSLLVPVSQNSEIIKFSELAKYLFKSEIYDIQISVLTFLNSFKGKVFDERDFEFKKMVDVLATLLSITLQSKNYIVKYEAFHTYASLAPSLGKICRQTVILAPHLASDIKSYITKVPISGFLTERERMQILQKIVICQPEIFLKDIKQLLPLKSI